jgi:hypothetical protein
MEINEEKIDEVVLALLYLNFHGDHDAIRAWKSFDWDAMDRLHKKGFISDPKSKSKSVLVTEEGPQKNCLRGISAPEVGIKPWWLLCD